MNRLAWWIAHTLAETLEADERDAFLGDQAELGKSGLRAAYEALGLVFNRPGKFLWWFIVPYCPFLVSQSMKIGAVIIKPPITIMDPLLTPVAVMLGIMSWTSGFFVGTRSGRIIGANSVLVLIVWLTSLGLSLDGLDSPASVLLLHLGIVVLPAIAGLVRGGKGQCLTTGTTAAIAAAPSLIVMWVVTYLAIWGQRSGGESSPWKGLLVLGLVLFITSYPGALLFLFSRRRPSSSLGAAT
jgi:hypothetical protein